LCGKSQQARYIGRRWRSDSINQQIDVFVGSDKRMNAGLKWPF